MAAVQCRSNMEVSVRIQDTGYRIPKANLEGQRRAKLSPRGNPNRTVLIRVHLWLIQQKTPKSMKKSQKRKGNQAIRGSGSGNQDIRSPGAAISTPLAQQIATAPCPQGAGRGPRNDDFVPVCLTHTYGTSGINCSFVPSRAHSPWSYLKKQSMS